MGIAEGAVKGVGVVVGVVLLAGAAGGGIVRDPQTGRIDPKASLNESAAIGGDKAGDAVDNVSESFGRGAGSAITSSRVLQAGALGATAYYGNKAWKNRTPTVSGGDDPNPAEDDRPVLTPTPAPLTQEKPTDPTPEDEPEAGPLEPGRPVVDGPLAGVVVPVPAALFAPHLAG